MQDGQAIGQPFNVQNFSWEWMRCAGTTTWNQMPYGVVLDRIAIPGNHGQSDRNDWVGNWAMDHDGWQGTLSITALTDVDVVFWKLTKVTAEYTAANGVISSVTGYLDLNNPQCLCLTIAFPGNSQPFTIYKFSWETDNAAGTTVWSGTTYGVRLHKIA